MSMNTQKTKYGMLRLGAIVTAALVLLMVVSAALPLPAQAQRPRPRQRTVNWIRSSKGRHRTARYAGKGGDHSPDPCMVEMVDEELTVVVRKFTESQAMKLGYLEPSVLITVKPCWTSDQHVTALSYSLTDVQGITRNAEGFGEVFFELDFSQPTGTYTLSATSSSGAFPPSFVAIMDTRPQITVANPDTGERLLKLHRGQTIGLDYSGFRPTQMINVELFGLDAALAAEPWQFMPDNTGNYAEAIVLPLLLDPYDYVVAACQDECPIVFDVGDLGYAFPTLPEMGFTKFEVEKLPVAYSYSSGTKSGVVALKDIGSTSEADTIFHLSYPTTTRKEEPDLGWAEPGASILAVERKASEDHGIWLYFESADEPRQLTFAEGEEWEPDFSPDGRSILYRSGGNRLGQGELRVVDLDTGEDRQLAGTSIFGHAPAWSPDGAQVAYDAKRPGDTTYQIYVFDLETGVERQVTRCQTNCRFPNWSSDGTYLAYHSTLGDMNQTPQIIWKVRTDGAEDPQALIRGMEPGRPVWTPGGAIIFESRSGLEIMTADGKDRTVIPDTAGAHAPDTPFPPSFPIQDDIEIVSPDSAESTSEGSSDDDFFGDNFFGDSFGGTYFQLAWVPECDALRAEVALLRTGQGACDEGVETWSLEVLAETLTDHFLSDGEKLLPVHLDGKANQRIGIFDHEGNQTGWVHLKEQQLWRTDYGTEVRHGAECQLTTNYSWDCAKG